MASASPTLAGFRAAFRRPELTLAEIMWRWCVGATATALFFFGLIEYLKTLPLTKGELLFLRTRQPYLVAQAIRHILRGSLNRAVMSGLLAAMMLVLLWMIAASVGRLLTVRSLLDYFRKGAASELSPQGVPGSASLQGLARLNFLRAAVALGAIFGFVGAAILAGFASPDSDPQPGIALLLFLPLAGLILLAWGFLNWLLSLAGMFAVRDGDDAVDAISSAIAFCRERIHAVAAVSTWTGLAHLVAFFGATTVVAIPLSFAALVQWRLVAAAVLMITLAYFAVADWIYMARLAGYVCIAEMPQALLTPLPPAPPGVAPGIPIQTTIDRDEPILSDVATLYTR